MSVELVLVRHDFEQFFFDCHHVLAWRDAGAVGDPEDVRIDCDGRLAEGDVQNHIGGFAADPR